MDKFIILLLSKGKPLLRKVQIKFIPFKKQPSKLFQDLLNLIPTPKKRPPLIKHHIKHCLYIENDRKGEAFTKKSTEDLIRPFISVFNMTLII